MIEIREVTDKKLLKKFVLFPIELYKNNPCFVPPIILDELNNLSKEKNPAFEYCEAKYWLAYKDNQIVGRIAAIINHRYIDKWGSKDGRFGYIDFVEDFKVAQLLLETAEKWLKSKGMHKIHGPLGFCDMDPEGMLVEGFEQMGTMTTIYNASYYPVYLEEMGYKKDVDWYEYKIIMPETVPKRLSAMSEKALRMNDLKILKVKKGKDYKPYAKQIFDLVNRVYSELYSVVEFSEKQMEVFTDTWLNYLDKDSIRLILDNNNQVIGLGVGFPSLARALRKCKGKLLPFGFLQILRAMKKNDTLELVWIAVDKNYQSKGVNAILLTEFCKICVNKGIKYADCNPQLENNTKVRSQWKYFADCVQNKKRRCYNKAII